MGTESLIVDIMLKTSRPAGALREQSTGGLAMLSSRHTPCAARCVSIQPSSIRHSAFTLVELLVVIAIIGVLIALLLPAVTGALGSANETAILTEIQNMDAALKDYKNNVGSFPPNTQTDGTGAGAHIDETKILADFKRHLKKAFPTHREPPYLIEALVGITHSSVNNDATLLPSGPLSSGMNAAESLVFWLGGFSDDPKYPISGIGGPSYRVDAISLNGAAANEADPIDNRKWRLDIKIDNLGPRNADNYFDEADSRFIVYRDPQDANILRRINFWYLKPSKLTSPYVYFDASRATSADSGNDVPAMARLSSFEFVGADADALNELFYVHAIKRLKSSANEQNPFEYANDGTFQIVHSGTDEAWGIFPMVNPNPPVGDPTNPLWLINSKEFHDNLDTSTQMPLYYPVGPWTGDPSDTLTNFANGTLEDAQP